MKFLGNLEPAEELEFALGLPQLMAQTGEGLPLGKELAIREISLDRHARPRPTGPPAVAYRSDQRDPGFELLR